jgi:hypothetical protein
MKKIVLYSALLLSLITFGQTKLVTKTGKIQFEASVPSFEEVKAKNETVTVILNTANGEIAGLALMKAFRFKVALMEEHFNENYVESDKFPKATFKGKIENFDFSKLNAVAKDYTIKGKLEMHGKTKEVAISAKVNKVDGGVKIDADFTVTTDDFAIDIPAVVSKKLSKNKGFYQT